MLIYIPIVIGCLFGVSDARPIDVSTSVRYVSRENHCAIHRVRPETTNVLFWNTLFP